MDVKDFILACSTLLGPVVSALIAIYYTRYADEKRIKDSRRFEVFRNLMKTRGFQLHQDHVMSLNLIPSDFHDDTDVMAKFKEYINHLYRPVPENQSESQRFFEERDLLFGKLLVAIAGSLKISISADELKHFTYSPVGWASIEHEQQQARKLLIQVLQGTAPIAIKPVQLQSNLPGQPALFPEAPVIKK